MSSFTARLADAASGVLLSTAQVTKVRSLPGGFTVVELTAEAFRRAAWVPGARLRLRARRGTLALRTYTPVNEDSARGTVELIGFVHGDGPGSRWFRLAAAGDTAEVLGPQRSIDLRSTTGSVVFIGDESSVGLAVALQSQNRQVSYLFEARDPDGLASALAVLRIGEQVTVLPRETDRARLLRQARNAAPGTPYTIVVTGDAATVHAIRRDSRQWTRIPERTIGKAYWAQGRTGLD